MPSKKPGHDLETLLRRRQDELRGHPQTRWERLRKRLHNHNRALDLLLLVAFYCSLAFLVAILIAIGWLVWRVPAA